MKRSAAEAMQMVQVGALGGGALRVVVGEVFCLHWVADHRYTACHFCRLLVDALGQSD